MQSLIVTLRERTRACISTRNITVRRSKAELKRLRRQGPVGKAPELVARERHPRQKKFTAADALFQRQFLDNSFGAVCNMCDKWWLTKDVSSMPLSAVTLLENAHPQNIKHS